MVGGAEALYFNSFTKYPLRLHSKSPQRHLREGAEICDELIATDRLLGFNDEEDEDLIDPERLTYFQVMYSMELSRMMTIIMIANQVLSLMGQTLFGSLRHSR